MACKLFTIIFCCFFLCGCEKKTLYSDYIDINPRGYNLKDHTHIYGIVHCGDSLDRIMCKNYPCGEGCLRWHKYNKEVIVKTSPKEPWEITPEQAERAIYDSKKCFINSVTYKVDEGIFFKVRRIDWQSVAVNDFWFEKAIGRSK